MLVMTPDLASSDPKLLARSADLNPTVGYSPADDILRDTGKTRPIARYVSEDDVPHPPAPAWYLPAANDLYIHVDEAGIGRVPEIAWSSAWDSTDVDLARILGLYCHEVAHAAISDDMTPVQTAATRHASLLGLLEELRVENHAVRRVPMVRRFLRASFAIILAGLPDDFENKGHVVRAWAITRGRTLAGIAAPDETEAVDTAARTLLGDDTVDALTDLLQEALTLRLDRTVDKQRIVDICDEWVELVGEPPEHAGCTGCARERREGEESDDTAGGGGDKADVADPSDGSGTDGDASDEGDDAGPGDGSDEGDRGDVDKGASAWGTAGHEGDDEGDDDSEDSDLLTDEDAELMAMLKRDLEDLMQDEWTRENDPIKIADAATWAAKVFGNRKPSARVSQSEPTAEMRQHVVQVAAALSRLSLPTIIKTAKQSEVPPGRLRSREALRASAERAQGRMVTARPWRGTVRRHASARPLVVGVATDTSGSMKWAEDGVAEFAYVYTNAGHRIGARTAAVTFGDRVHRIARPGEVMTHVQRKTANDGTEQFDHAIAALDGVLHLTDPGYAARLLFVISDGALVKGGEPAKAQEWLRRMDKAGTHIVWITDREMSSTAYSHWLSKLAVKLPNLTVLSVETRPHRRGYPTGAARTVFEALNSTALEAVGRYI